MILLYIFVLYNSNKFSFFPYYDLIIPLLCNVLIEPYARPIITEKYNLESSLLCFFFQK